MQFVQRHDLDIRIRTFVRDHPPGRYDTDAEVICVKDYGRISPAQFAGCEAVINFVGIARARDPRQLMAVNVELARSLAIAARDAGVSQFVHLSSLSLHGAVPRITNETAIAPTSRYGASKAEAEAALKALATEDFVLTMLRIPAIYGRGARSKIGDLARLFANIPVFPAPTPMPRRSVISHDNLARVLLQLLQDRCRGVVYAADPQPFTLELLAQVFPRMRLLRVPALALEPLRLACPTVHHRLYESMEVDGNLLFEPRLYPLQSTAASLTDAFAAKPGAA
jgi:UDP-glucose 4-epimerase